MQQSYRIKFFFDKKAGKCMIFSLPQTNQYQDIKELSILPKPADLIFDEWGNTAAIFNKKTTLEFLYSPKSIKKSINPNWKLDDYKKNKETLFFTKPNRFINEQDERITKLAKSIIKKNQRVSEITKSFYNFTLEYLSYGKPIKGLYPCSQALKEKITDCGGFSTLLLSLFHSVGIPGRLVVGYLLKQNIYTKLFSNFEFCILNFKFFMMHAWLEILLPDNTWFPLDPSIEWRRKHGLTKRKGGFGEIPADRLVTSFGQDFSILINGKKHKVDLLQHPVYL